MLNVQLLFIHGEFPHVLRNSVGARRKLVVRIDRRDLPIERREQFFHVLRIGVKPLSAGSYRVHWRVLSVDTHVTEGNFSFHVGP